MQERIRLMTASTVAYAHALQNACLGRRADDIVVCNFRLLALKANYRSLPNVRTTTRLIGDVFRGSAIFTD